MWGKQASFIIIVGSLLACTIMPYLWFRAPNNLESGAAPRELRGMLDSDLPERDLHHLTEERRTTAEEDTQTLNVGLFASGRFWMDLSHARVKQSSLYRAGHEAEKAIDGNPTTKSITNRDNPSYLEVQVPSRRKITGVEIRFHAHANNQQPPVYVSVDDQLCATIRSIGNNLLKVPFAVPCFGSRLRIFQDSAAKHMIIWEVRIEEESFGNGVICPFLATMLNEGKLTGCVHSKEDLLKATVLAGLAPAKAESHIEENFKNQPSGSQDICNMEGAPNEHKTSTGINDCITFFAECKRRHGDTPAKCNIVKTEDKFCGAPNTAKFEAFFAKCDADRDSYLNMTELGACADEVLVNDQNEIGEGTIRGSFGLLLEVFGTGGVMHKSCLETVLLKRRFPLDCGYRLRPLPAH